MSDVKRWDVFIEFSCSAGCYCESTYDTHGDYVLHSDYAALEARCKQAEKDRDELRAALRDCILWVDHATAGEVLAPEEQRAVELLTRLGDLEQTDAGLRWKT